MEKWILYYLQVIHKNTTERQQGKSHVCILQTKGTLLSFYRFSVKHYLFFTCDTNSLIKVKVFKHKVNE